MRTTARLLTATCAALTSGALLASPAMANAPTAPAGKTSSPATHAPNLGPTTSLRASGAGSFSAEGSTSRASIDHAKVTTAPLAGGPSITLSLPQQAATTAPHATGQGTVAFDASKSSAVTTEVLALKSGDVSIQTTLLNASSPTSFKYSVQEGLVPQAQGDGAIELVKTDANGVSLTVGRIDAPWAIDAGGHSVPTEYQIAGNSITQVVHPQKNTAFPVVADPTYGVTYGISPTAYFNKSETHRLQDASNYAALCGVVGVADAALGILCGLNIANMTKTAKLAQSKNLCMKIFAPSPVTLFAQTYGGGNCVGKY